MLTQYGKENLIMDSGLITKQSELEKYQRIIDPAVLKTLHPPDLNLASEFYKRLVKMISEFDAELNQDEEVGVRLVNFGQTISFSVEAIGYWDPNLLRFYGHLEDNSPVELIQHVSQISFLLTALNRINPDEPTRKIVFRQQKQADKSHEG
jgi:hypothetical protein